MKKGLFLALPALLLGVTGCKVLNQLKGLTEAFVEWEDDDTGKEVKKAALASSIESLNTRNYFLKYRAAETMAGKAILYEVDGWNVKVGPTYYDYSKATSEKVGYSYIQDSNGTWVKGTQDLNNEPWASKFVTIYEHTQSDWALNETSQLYEMVQSKLDELSFKSATMNLETVDGSLRVTFHVEVDTSKSGNEGGTASFDAKFFDFGKAKVTLPNA